MKEPIFIFAECEGESGYVIPIDDIQSITPHNSKNNKSVIYTRSKERNYLSTETPEKLFEKIKLAQSV